MNDKAATIPPHTDMRTKLILTTLLLLASTSLFAQSFPVQTSEEKRAEMRDKIGLDMTVPDFVTKKIDATVMGNRLAGILDYLMENYHQAVCDRKLGLIASEQNEAMENVYFQLKKLKFVNAVKKGNELTIILQADLQKNPVNVKQTDVILHFTDGVSESDKVNEMFSYISHYVQAREQLQ